MSVSSLMLKSKLLANFECKHGFNGRCQSTLLHGAYQLKNKKKQQKINSFHESQARVSDDTKLKVSMFTVPLTTALHLITTQQAVIMWLGVFPTCI